MGRLILELENSLNWDLVRRQDYAQIPPSNSSPFKPIGDITAVLESRFVMVGIMAPTAAIKPWWRLGGKASMRLLILPSTTSIFPAGVVAAEQNCLLNALTLIEFPPYKPSPYLFVLSIPRWISHVTVEIWTYSGADSDSDSEAIARIERRVNQLQP